MEKSEESTETQCSVDNCPECIRVRAPYCPLLEEYKANDPLPQARFADKCPLCLRIEHCFLEALRYRSGPYSLVDHQFVYGKNDEVLLEQMNFWLQSSHHILLFPTKISISFKDGFTLVQLFSEDNLAQQIDFFLTQITKIDSFDAKKVTKIVLTKRDKLIGDSRILAELKKFDVFNDFIEPLKTVCFYE